VRSAPRRKEIDKLFLLILSCAGCALPVLDRPPVSLDAATVLPRKLRIDRTIIGERAGTRHGSLEREN
jgi:hypothetical protein